MNTNWTPFSMWYFIIDLEAFVNFLFKFLSPAINRPSVSLFFLPLSPPYLAFCEALLVCVVNSWRPLVKLLSRVLHSYLSTPFLGTSPVVQWLRLQASTTRGMGLIPHAEGPKKKKKERKLVSSLYSKSISWNENTFLSTYLYLKHGNATTMWMAHG